MANQLEIKRGGWQRALWSGLLSLLIPGLGQIHVRARHLGTLLLAIDLVASAAVRGLTWLRPTPIRLLALVIGIVLFILAMHMGSAIDAVLRARRTSVRSPAPWWRTTWLTLLVFLCLAFAIGQALPLRWHSFSIPSASNLPSIQVGDYLMTGELSGGQFPTRGDMIVFRLPRDPRIPYIKRVIGLPGDHVRMVDGQLILNGQQLPRLAASDAESGTDASRAIPQRYRETLPDGRSYFILKAGSNGPLDNTQDYIVPESHFFVLGDNRDNSLDSRVLSQMGYVPTGNIIGRAEIIFWTVDRRRIFSRLSRLD